MKTHHFKHSLLAALLCTGISAWPVRAQTVINSSRIGGYSEDITFVTSGLLKDNIVILDGFDLYAVPNKKKDKGPMVKLFDVKVPELDDLPTGIAYVESEGLFVLNQSVVNTNKLYFFDQTGAYKGRRDIQYLNSSYLPGHVEGLAYIPASSSFFPDHLVMVVWDDLSSGPKRLEVMRRDGVVEAEIYNAGWPASFTEDGIGDVSFLTPNRLLVTTYDNNIWTLDFSGAIVSGPVTLAGSFGFEGIIQMSDSNVVVVDYPQKLLFLDSALSRLTGSDRNDVIGLNLNIPNGIGWNSDTNQLLIGHDNTATNSTPAIASVPTTLDSATQVVNFGPDFFHRQLTYLSDEHLIATLHFGPSVNDRAILLYNNDGTFNSQVSLSPTSLGFNPGAPRVLAYIPTTHEFVVSFNGPNNNPSQPVERRSLRVLSRAGTLVRTIDLTNTGTALINGLDYFSSPGGERFIIMDSVGRVFITDLNGSSRGSNGLLFGEFNIRIKFGLIVKSDITAITSGPLAGSFAIVASSGECVIFKLD